MLALYSAKKGPATWGSEFGVPVTEFGRALSEIGQTPSEFGRALSEIGQTPPKSRLQFRFRPNSAHIL